MGAQQQFEQKKILVFDDFEGMNTQSNRHALDKKKLAWMENLQPIGPNNLLSVPAPGAVLQTLTGEIITKKFYFNGPGDIDYDICFCTSGAAYAVTNPGGAVTVIATAGTFTPTPDVTQWNTERILIADPTAGYCAWSPASGLVRYGGVSPNIEVTAGGSGYTSPVVAITGGSGAGAAATVQETDGVVTGITLTDPGAGYAAGDTLVFSITDGGGGSGATAKGHVWPNAGTNSFTTLAVYQGRVWLSDGNVGNYTGTGATYGGVGYDDFLTADAAGSFTINDPDLIRAITALRALNNYLFIIGDNSVKQIGNISVSGTTTNFTIITLSSDQGTIYRDTVVSYNRLVLFANTVGVYAVFGSSVEKISDDMDGVFRNIDFVQAPCAAVNDINNIHCYRLLVLYNDPLQGTRALIIGFQNKKWFVMSQGNNLGFMVTAVVNGVTQTLAASGADIMPILSEPDTPVDVILSTALSPDDAPYIAKSTIRAAVAQTVAATATVGFTTESERTSQNGGYIVSNLLQFVNNLGQPLNFVNQFSQPLNFFGASGFVYASGQVAVAGIYLGATISGRVARYSLNSIMLEYRTTAAFGNSQVNIS